jgi:hypothetical protein
VWVLSSFKQVAKAVSENDREHDQARRDSKERHQKSLAKEDKEHPEGKRTKEEKETGSSWSKVIGAGFMAWLLRDSGVTDWLLNVVNDVVKPSLDTCTLFRSW